VILKELIVSSKFNTKGDKQQKKLQNCQEQPVGIDVEELMKVLDKRKSE